MLSFRTSFSDRLVSVTTLSQGLSDDRLVAIRVGTAPLTALTRDEAVKVRDEIDRLIADFDRGDVARQREALVKALADFDAAHGIVSHDAPAPPFKVGT